MFGWSVSVRATFLSQKVRNQPEVNFNEKLWSFSQSWRLRAPSASAVCRCPLTVGILMGSVSLHGSNRMESWRIHNVTSVNVQNAVCVCALCAALSHYRCTKLKYHLLGFRRIVFLTNQKSWRKMYVVRYGCMQGFGQDVLKSETVSLRILPSCHSMLGRFLLFGLFFSKKSCPLCQSC